MQILRWSGAFGRCRLCRRVALSVFLAILSVEIAIFVPSLWKFENERLSARRELAAAAVIAFLRSMPEANFERGLDKEIERLLGIAHIASVRLLDPSGRTIAVVGDAPPPEQLQASSGWRQLDSGRLLIWEPVARGHIHTSYFCIKTPDLIAELLGYGIRILGLVMMIALIVTGVTMIVLRRLVLRRIIALEDGLSAAGRAPGEAAGIRLPEHGDDELSSVARRFNAMTREIGQAVTALRDREAQLEQLTQVLEARVAERTVHLADALAQAQQASRAKTAFLANMSHELRTPLNAMIGFAELMSAELLGPIGHPRYRSYTGDIVTGGRRLLTVIDHVLDIAEVEAGRLVLERQPVDVTAMLMRVAADCAAAAQAAGVELIVAPADSPILVMGDEHRLAQIARHLIDNAIAFNRRGGLVRVSVETVAGPCIAIEVEDTGVGMAPADLERLMQPFEQHAGVFARSHQGAGLGLPLARCLVEAHGGTLELSSVPGQGTRVQILLTGISRLDRAAA